MQLYRAETPGPVKDTKLTPRITETAKSLWYIYLTMTIVCALSYYFSGMNYFDAIAHSFSTVSIGGFSTHDQSIGYFNNNLVELVAMFFMLASGINFSLHFLAFKNANIKPYLGDDELRVYLKILLIICIVCSSYNAISGDYETMKEAIRDSFFQTISIATTTGFTTTEFQNWSGFLPLLLIISCFIGACAGSTGGGIKVIRVLLFFKQGIREIKRLIHPNAIFPIKINDKPISERIIEAVWGFLAVYVVIFTILLLALMATEIDFTTAFSALSACINNLGPGLGEVSQNYYTLSDVAKWILCFAMLLGRLEIFTLLVLFSPSFWRH
jgi:trk system potassium uptake protein TrkH